MSHLKTLHSYANSIQILTNLQLLISKGYKLSKNKGFSDTSVGRYSLALYELAEESNATH